MNNRLDMPAELEANPSGQNFIIDLISFLEELESSYSLIHSNNLNESLSRSFRQFISQLKKHTWQKQREVQISDKIKRTGSSELIEFITKSYSSQSMLPSLDSMAGSKLSKLINSINQRLDQKKDSSERFEEIESKMKKYEVQISELKSTVIRLNQIISQREQIDNSQAKFLLPQIKQNKPKHEGNLLKVPESNFSSMCDDSILSEGRPISKEADSRCRLGVPSCNVSRSDLKGHEKENKRPRSIWSKKQLLKKKL